jgi:hypothetical protein
MPARAVRAPERFRGGLPLRRPATMRFPNRDLARRGDSPARGKRLRYLNTGMRRPTLPILSADLARLSARGELVVGVGRWGVVLGVLARR